MSSNLAKEGVTFFTDNQIQLGKHGSFLELKYLIFAYHLWRYYPQGCPGTFVTAFTHPFERKISFEMSVPICSNSLKINNQNGKMPKTAFEHTIPRNALG